LEGQSLQSCKDTGNYTGQPLPWAVVKFTVCPNSSRQGIAMIELNPIYQRIAELNQRLATLRGYL